MVCKYHSKEVLQRPWSTNIVKKFCQDLDLQASFQRSSAKTIVYKSHSTEVQYQAVVYKTSFQIDPAGNQSLLNV